MSAERGGFEPAERCRGPKLDASLSRTLRLTWIDHIGLVPVVDA